jgi:hypothetical protein
VGPGVVRAILRRRRPLQLDVGADLNEYIADVARMGSIGAGLLYPNLWRTGTDTVPTGRWGRHGRFQAHGLGMVSREPPEITPDSGRPLRGTRL